MFTDKKIYNVYDVRSLGREVCQTEGSEHYKTNVIEPLDIIINKKDRGENFCLGSIIKYAMRYPFTRNINDLKKIADYAHILCGVAVKIKEEAHE